MDPAKCDECKAPCNLKDDHRELLMKIRQDCPCYNCLVVAMCKENDELNCATWQAFNEMTNECLNNFLGV